MAEVASWEWWRKRVNYSTLFSLYFSPDFCFLSSFLLFHPTTITLTSSSSLAVASSLAMTMDSSSLKCSPSSSQMGASFLQCPHLCQNVCLVDNNTVWYWWVRKRTESRGLQRDVVYLGWPIAPSYMSPNAGGRGGGGCEVSATEYSCTQEPK